MVVTRQDVESGEYAIRWFEEGDRRGILSLYEAEWGRRLQPDWFDWKYVDDPYLSHVPITVAERDGEIVGTQAYVPFMVRWDDRSVLALQPADAMVHPDHRRRGLYTRITREAIEYYVDEEPAFFFNFPNPGALRVQQNLGWSAVGRIATRYRVQRPDTLFDAEDSGALTEAIGRLATPLVRGYLGVRGLRTASSRDVTVTRHASIPAELLESLSRIRRPERLHVHRDARFYRWWFSNPAYEHTAYVARRDGEPVAGIVTRTGAGRSVKVIDAVPRWSDRISAAFDELLAAIVADNADADVLAVTESTLPGALLSRYGFVPDTAPLLSRLCTSTTMAVRPLSDDGTAGPIPLDTLTDETDWRVTFAEQDRD